MKKMILTVQMLAVLALYGESYQWEQSDGATSLGDGAFTIEWLDGKVKSFKKTSSSDEAITGSALEFASTGGEIVTSSDYLTLDIPLVFNSSLTFRNPYEQYYIYDGEPLSGNVEKKIFENMSLDELNPSSCIYNDNNYEGLVFAIDGEGIAFNVVRSQGKLEAQFQTIDGDAVKSIKVVFRQVGEDIYAIIGHSKYIGDITCLGKDFDTLEGASDYRIAIDNPGRHGYSVDYMVFIRTRENTDSAAVVVKQAVTGSGVITNGAARKLVFPGNNALSATGEYTGDFYLDYLSNMVFKDRTEGAFALSGTINGGIKSVISFEADNRDAIAVPGQSVEVIGDNVTGTETTHNYFDNQWQEIVRDVPLSLVTNVFCEIKGPNIIHVQNAYVCFVSNSVDNMTRFYQAQTQDGGWFKTIDFEIAEQSVLPDSIKLCTRVTGAQYCSWNLVPGTGNEKYGYILTLQDAIAKGGKGYHITGYCIRSIGIKYKDSTKAHSLNSSLSGVNNMMQGVINVAGAENAITYLKLKNANSLPPYGRINIHTNGIVEFTADGINVNKGYANNSCLIDIHPGGRIRQSGASVFGQYGQIINNNNGIVEIGYGKAPGSNYSHKDAQTYMRYLNMSNRAKVEGNLFPRVAYKQNALWTSSGEGPNIVNCGIILTGNEEGKESKINFDCASDLILNGPLISYDNIHHGLGLTNCVAEKSGSATLFQNDVNIVNAPVRIFEGKWVLGKSNLVSSDKVFELHGGTLGLADGVVQSLDILPLKAGSVCGVALGEGATLEAGAISFDDDAATLAVTGSDIGDGKRTGLRIGTSAILDNTTLKKIRYNASPVSQDNEGWIWTIPGATVIILR